MPKKPEKSLRNFSEIFGKDVTYDNIKSHAKARPHPLLRKYIFGKSTGGKGQIDPLPPTLIFFWVKKSAIRIFPSLIAENSER